MSERYLEDFAVGQTFGSGRLAVDEARIKSFAAEFNLQRFHLDEQSARSTVLRGLAATGRHTAATTMRLLVESELKSAGGVIGAGGDELRWPRPVRPGDELHLQNEVLEVRPSTSQPGWGLIKVRTSIGMPRPTPQKSLWLFCSMAGPATFTALLMSHHCSRRPVRSCRICAASARRAFFRPKRPGTVSNRRRPPRSSHLMYALKIEEAIIAGYGLGACTTKIAAALWAKRVKATILVSGYLIGSQVMNKMPLPPKAELEWCYQYYATERDCAGYEMYRHDFRS